MNVREVLLVLFSLAATGFCQQARLTSIVNLDGGQVQGIVQQAGNQSVNFYQGIQYGRANRFKKPERIDSWNGVYNATSFRFACPQPGFVLANTSTPTTNQSTNLNQTQFASEDCLYLNVWSAANQTGPTRPVMVFIHGGNYISGTIFSSALDGRYLASLGNVVVVTVQYRLNAFGFLHSNEDDDENLGIQDQILALRWVRRNIDRFGGNPNQVTIFGQGAGASCVGILVLSPESDRLFQRAIMQSGSPIGRKGAEDEETGWAKTRMLASLLGCNDRRKGTLIACLQGKSVEEILNASIAMNAIGQQMRPVYGEDILPRSPVETLMSGMSTWSNWFRNRNVDLMFGVNGNQSLAQLSRFLPQLANATSLTIEEARNCIQLLLTFYQAPYLNDVIEYYIANQTESGNQTISSGILTNITTDFTVTCPTILFGEQLGQTIPSNQYYSYRLDQSPSLNRSNCSTCPRGEVAYLFGEVLSLNASTQDMQLSRDMIRAWAQFASTGTPGQIGSAQWSPAFMPNVFAAQFMSLNASNYQMVTDGAYEQTCDTFWKPKLFSLYRYGSED